MQHKALAHQIENASEDALRQAVQELLASHFRPVFGASRAIEHEIAAFNALKALGYLPPDPDEFQLVEFLRVTKTKARNLLYQAALRQEEGGEDTDEKLRKVLQNPRIVREGNVFLIEVPQPLTMDRLRRRVRQLGFLSDGSFSGSVARVPEAALIALVQNLISQDGQRAIMRDLHRQVVSENTFPGILIGALQVDGRRLVGEAGGTVAASIGDTLGLFFENNTQALISILCGDGDNGPE
jgi:hypothetical protein